jgi:hypothetical protein
MDGPGSIAGDSSSPSTSSGGKAQSAVSEEFAGDIVGLPFEAWHIVNPVVLPLSDDEKERLAAPFARIMEKYGLGKLAKDEIVFAFYLTAAVFGRVKAVSDDKRIRKAEAAMLEKNAEVEKGMGA